MKKIIFLSGIHGVGKGYIKEEIKKEINIPIYEASELIRLNGVVTDENKKVSNVKFTKDNKIETIDISYFKRMNIIGIISLYDEIDIIEERLDKRDNIHFDKNILNDLQNTEIKNTKQLSEELGIPLLAFKNGDDMKILINFINNL